jgi:predicted nucleic acid-binding Zn ribbon protein
MADVQDLSTDEGIQRYIDSLPSEQELRAELGELLPERRCAVCRSLLPIGSRKDMRTCSAACRTSLYERRNAAVLAARRKARRDAASTS